MQTPNIDPQFHLNSTDWLYTAKGDNRGFIQPQKLTELWFHSGSNCNLHCSFCYEGSGPGDKRLQALSLEDVLPFLEEARALGVKRFGFTGGEPFVNKNIIDILDAALDIAPCLVLTNGTEPLHKALPRLAPFQQSVHPLSFRVSLDSPNPETHDAHRGEGAFFKALKGLALLNKLGFPVSVAHMQSAADEALAVRKAYLSHFASYAIPEDVPFVSFPNLLQPCATPDVPHISEHCMVQYKSQMEREKFMCNYSKMVVKKGDAMSVYACTLVDDDRAYDLGSTLTEAMKYRVMLRHHRCYSCFVSGTSCSGG